jgi:hypothetical protein
MVRWKFALVSLVALAGLGTLWGCGDEETKVVEPEPMITVTVTAAPGTLDTGGKVVVEATLDTELPGPFTYAWQANGGTFVDVSADSTSWIAPDESGAYRLSVVVSDGGDVGIGMADVSVGQYVPTDSPYYMGASYCMTCHNGGMGGDQYVTWSQSVHAKALSALSGIGQDQNAFCLPCHTVGSKGLDADPALDNGGYDETAVARLANVQCENCHGPASGHPPTGLGGTMSATLCSACHEGEHHPTGSEWAESAHAQLIEAGPGEAPPHLRNSCAKCHNGLYADTFLDNPEGFTNPAANPTEAAPITCAVCHDPHGNENPASLRDAAVTDRALPNGVLVEAAGAGRLCMACHNGRRTETQVDDQVEEGTEHFGPHHSVQGDMLAGVNAYQKVNETFAWSSSQHILAEDACVTCHNHPTPFNEETGIAYTGHQFIPTVEACAPCHGVLTDFSDVSEKYDYDGDGNMAEGVQGEVEGLLAALEETILDASASPEQRAILEASFEDSLGSPRVTTVTQRAAGYNWAFVSYDGSTGVHNATYSVQLLQQSILSLNPRALPSGAHILRSDD